MKWFYKPTGILAAVVIVSAVFATSDRLPGQSPTESQPSAEFSAEDDALDFDADVSSTAESQRAGMDGAKAGVDLDANVSPTAESQSRKLKEFKTLDEVRKLYKRGRAPKGSNGDGFTSAASDWGDMMGEMGGTGSMMGGLPPDPREQALSKIRTLRKRLKTASEKIQRKIAEQLQIGRASCRERV